MPKIESLLLLALLLPAAALAQPDAAAPLSLALVSPTPQEALFGQVRLEVRVEAEAGVREVVFFVDGTRLGSVFEPPFRLEVDVGEQNRDRRLRFLARDELGREASLEHVAKALRIDEGLDLHLQPLYVSVTERGGLRVLDLEADDFTVFDQDVRQEIVTFERGNLPLAAVLLVDGSLSMQGQRLANARRGVHVFARGLQPLDEATVIVFTDTIVHSEQLHPEQRPEQLLQGLEAAGGTSINDHLYLAMQHLETRLGRRVVVLLSDGRDNHSLLRAREVLEVARESQAMVYWLLLEGRGPGARPGTPLKKRIGRREHPTSAWRTRRQAIDELDGLERLVEESGGRILPIGSDNHIQPAFEDLLAELREQYALGFYPSRRNADGSWHVVRVEVSRQDLSIRHREGYYDR